MSKLWKEYIDNVQNLSMYITIKGEKRIWHGYTIIIEFRVNKIKIYINCQNDFCFICTKRHIVVYGSDL